LTSAFTGVISDIGNKRLKGELSMDAFEAKVDKYVLTTSTLCLVLAAVLAIIIVTLPSEERVKTPRKTGQWAVIQLNRVFTPFEIISEKTSIVECIASLCLFCSTIKPL